MSDENDQLSVADHITNGVQALEQSGIARGIVDWNLAGGRKRCRCWWLVGNVELTTKPRKPIVGVIFASVVECYGGVAIAAIGDGSTLILNP